MINGWNRIRLSMDDIANGEQRFLVEAFRAVYGRTLPRGAALLGEKVIGQNDDFTCFYLTPEAIEHCSGLSERYSFEPSEPPVPDQVAVLAGDPRVLGNLVTSAEAGVSPQIDTETEGKQSDEKIAARMGFYKFTVASVLLTVAVTLAHGIVQWKEFELNTVSEENALVRQYLEETRGEDLGRRRYLAQYLSMMSPTEEARNRWQSYHNYTLDMLDLEVAARRRHVDFLIQDEQAQQSRRDRAASDADVTESDETRQELLARTETLEAEIAQIRAERDREELALAALEEQIRLDRTVSLKRPVSLSWPLAESDDRTLPFETPSRVIEPASPVAVEGTWILSSGTEDSQPAADNPPTPASSEARSVSAIAEPVSTEEPQPLQESVDAGPSAELPAVEVFQIAALDSADRAEALQREIVEQGFEALILDPPPDEQPPLHRVRIGPFGDETEVTRIRTLLEDAGYEPQR